MEQKHKVAPNSNIVDSPHHSLPLQQNLYDKAPKYTTQSTSDDLTSKAC